MKVKIVIVALCLMSFEALANGSVHHNNTMDAASSAVSSSNANAMSTANATSAANATQGQQQGQLQGQQQGQIGIQGNQQAVNLNSTTSHQAPGFAMSSMFPTAPCQAVLGVGFSFIGGGGAASGSRTLDECEKREAARIAHGIGQQQMAVEIMCMGEYASKTSQCAAFRPPVVARTIDAPTTRSRDDVEVKQVSAPLMQGF
jgi:hypothetical protein